MMQTERAHRRRARVLGVILAVISILFVFVVCEIALRLASYPGAESRRDPFFGFPGSPPAYQLTDVPGEGPRFAPRANLPLRRSFAAEKPAEVFRIFTFGGSTTYGEPFGPEGSFSNFLERELSAMFPERSIEVINMGISGYGSVRVRNLVEEAAAYEPDLFVVYTGQNESRDMGFHYWEIHRSPFTSQLLSTLFESRGLAFLHQRYLALENLLFGHREISFGASMISRVLAVPFSEETFESTGYYSVPRLVLVEEEPAAAPGVRKHAKTVLKRILRRGHMETSLDELERTFRSSLEGMIEAARRADTPILFLEKVRNPKVRSVVSSSDLELPTAAARGFDRGAWHESYARGIELLRDGHHREAIDELQRARELFPGDRDWTLLLYLGEAYEGLGDHERARALYDRRLNEEHYALNRVLQTVTAERDVPVLSTEAALRRATSNGILGYENYFVDAVHMTLDGYRTIGRSVAQRIASDEALSRGKLGEQNSPVARGAARSDNDRWNRDARVQTSLAWARFNLGDVDGAIETAKRALAADSSEMQAYLVLGFAYARLERWDESRKAWERLDELYAAARH